MVDILGRSGELKEVEEFIESMFVKFNELVWLVLFSVCRMYYDVDRVEKVVVVIF